MFDRPWTNECRSDGRMFQHKTESEVREGEAFFLGDNLKSSNRAGFSLVVCRSEVEVLWFAFCP